MKLTKIGDMIYLPGNPKGPKLLIRNKKIKEKVVMKQNRCKIYPYSLKFDSEGQWKENKPALCHHYHGDYEQRSVD